MEKQLSLIEYLPIYLSRYSSCIVQIKAQFHFHYHGIFLKVSVMNKKDCFRYAVFTYKTDI